MTAKNLALTSNSDTSLNTVYTAPTSFNTRISAVIFTNTTTTAHSISIYHNNGTTDFLIDKLTLPGGIGFTRRYYELEKVIFNAGHILKVQSDQAAAFNISVNGTETEV